MSNTVRLASVPPLQTQTPLSLPSNRIAFSSSVSSTFATSFSICSENEDQGRVKALTNYSQEGSIGGGVDDSSPSSSLSSIDVKPIVNETQFDLVIAEAQRLHESVVILWMASWCRKCIYLKPKLEKLAADYHPRVKFYCIDVNNVPHKLVVRAGVTKMPTIQLWKDGKNRAEVIGGHKAYLVVNEVREMIETEE